MNGCDATRSHCVLIAFGSPNHSPPNVAHRKSGQRRDDLCAAALRTCVLAASHSETFKVNATAVQRGASIRLRHLQCREHIMRKFVNGAVRYNPLSDETTVDTESPTEDTYRS
jgi:hypothetical protein